MNGDDDEQDIASSCITRVLSSELEEQINSLSLGYTSLSFTLNRLDYNVGESSWVMGDEVKVKFSLPVK